MMGNGFKDIPQTVTYYVLGSKQSHKTERNEKHIETHNSANNLFESVTCNCTSHTHETATFARLQRYVCPKRHIEIANIQYDNMHFFLVKKHTFYGQVWKGGGVIFACMISWTSWICFFRSPHSS